MTDMQNNIIDLHNLRGPTLPSRTALTSFQAETFPHGKPASSILLSDAVFAAPTQSENAKLETQADTESAPLATPIIETTILVQPNVELPVVFDTLSFSSHAFLRAEFLSNDNRGEQAEYEKLADFMARIRNNWMQIDSSSLEMMSWSVNEYIRQANTTTSN